MSVYISFSFSYGICLSVLKSFLCIRNIALLSVMYVVRIFSQFVSCLLVMAFFVQRCFTYSCLHARFMHLLLFLILNNRKPSTEVKGEFTHVFLQQLCSFIFYIQVLDPFGVFSHVWCDIQLFPNSSQLSQQRLLKISSLLQ